MRQRIITETCLGRSIGTDFNLNTDLNKIPQNQKDILVKVGQDFINQFDCNLGGYEHCDFGWLNDEVFVLGLEPSYQWEDLLVFQFDFKNKELSRVLTGTAFGPYGTNIAMKIKVLKDYKKKSKFSNFLNKWYDLLKEKLI